MQKLEGIHFYININNFNEIVFDEEKRTGNVTRSLHALDTFFSSIERYGKKNYPKIFVVEKVTGARLHLYVTDEILRAFDVVKAISAFSWRLSHYINCDIPKYTNLLNFRINIGVAFGEFYEFEFTTLDGYSEFTTIGYSANYAAKLQALSPDSKISICDVTYDSLNSEEKKWFLKIQNSSISKYGKSYYYTAELGIIQSPLIISDEDLESVKSFANSDNLKDINFRKVRKTLDFTNLSKTECRKLEGIPVFADIRGFTSQFNPNDSNLEQMAIKTQTILRGMYNTTTTNGGIHVQFQGDRELSLFHNVPEETINGLYIKEHRCFKQAILASMRMIDVVKPYSIHIGIGQDFGTLFATKIGARGEKDNVLLGMTVIQSDVMEDKHAKEDQIAITQAVYDGLKQEDAALADYFKKIDTGIYVTTIGYECFLRNTSFTQQSQRTRSNSYNGAWGDTY